MEYQYKNVSIRTELKSGDIGYIIYLHGRLYQQEYGYGLSFETYVAQGLYEFYKQYDAEKDCVWVCEMGNSIVGFLLLMHRPNNVAQLRFFLLVPEVRGMGLGKRLMELYLQWLRDHNYTSSYLWTTHEQQTAAALYQQYGFQLAEEHTSTTFGKSLIEQQYVLLNI